MEALRTALFPGSGSDKSDYKLAQGSMDRLDCLESTLWEAHRREASAATLDETRKTQVRCDRCRGYKILMRLSHSVVGGVESMSRRTKRNTSPGISSGNQDGIYLMKVELFQSI